MLLIKQILTSNLLVQITSKPLYSFAIKKANVLSQPIHGETTSMWQYDKVGKTPSKLKISTWSLRGLRPVIKREQLQHYMKKSNPDILCINQTKMDLAAYNKDGIILKSMFQNGVDLKVKKYKAQEDSENTFGDKHKFGSWYQYWNFCKVSSGYSGVLTLSKYKPIRCMEDFAIDHHFKLQGRCLTSQYQNFFLVNLHIPFSGLQLQRLLDRTQIYQQKLMQYVNHLKSQNKPVIMCGNFNVVNDENDVIVLLQKMKTPGFTPQQRNSFNKLLQQNKMIDSFRKLHPQKIAYTWLIGFNVKMRTDYILVSQNQNDVRKQKAINIGENNNYNNNNGESKDKFGLQIQKVDIINDVRGSDHLPVEAEINLIKI